MKATFSATYKGVSSFEAVSYLFAFTSRYIVFREVDDKPLRPVRSLLHGLWNPSAQVAVAHDVLAPGFFRGSTRATRPGSSRRLFQLARADFDCFEWWQPAVAVLGP